MNAMTNNQASVSRMTLARTLGSRVWTLAPDKMEVTASSIETVAFA